MKITFRTGDAFFNGELLLASDCLRLQKEYGPGLEGMGNRISRLGQNRSLKWEWPFIRRDVLEDIVRLRLWGCIHPQHPARRQFTMDAVSIVPRLPVFEERQYGRFNYYNLTDSRVRSGIPKYNRCAYCGLQDRTVRGYQSDGFSRLTHWSKRKRTAVQIPQRLWKSERRVLLEKFLGCSMDQAYAFYCSDACLTRKVRAFVSTYDLLTSIEKRQVSLETAIAKFK